MFNGNRHTLQSMNNQFNQLILNVNSYVKMLLCFIKIQSLISQFKSLNYDNSLQSKIIRFESSWTKINNQINKVDSYTPIKLSRYDGW